MSKSPDADSVDHKNSPSGDAPPTRGRRFFKLAKMTASVASEYAKSRVKEAFLDPDAAEKSRQQAHARTGMRVADTLGELKGAVMKVGQMASLAQDFLPQEVATALTRLHSSAPPMDFALIAKQVQQELGQAPDEAFASFDKEPCAAASIGQVHRARLHDGREVVCKVQYPGVDDAMDSDLSQLRLALRAGGLVKVPKEVMDATFAELRARLCEELDYRCEARNISLFRTWHKDDTKVVIPEMVASHSSRRVLTLVFERGDSFKVVGENYSQRQRDDIGVRLFEWMARQLFVVGAIHADPNPGNFAFRRDGTVVVYDFGCVKWVSQDILSGYRDVVVAGLAEDYAAVGSAMRKLGFIRAGIEADQLPTELFRSYRNTLVWPHQKTELFDYGTTQLHHELMEHLPKAMKHLNIFQPSPEAMMVERMVVGHYGNMRTLRAKVPVLSLLNRYLRQFENNPDGLIAHQTTPSVAGED